MGPIGAFGVGGSPLQGAPINPMIIPASRSPSEAGFRRHMKCGRLEILGLSIRPDVGALEWFVMCHLSDIWAAQHQQTEGFLKPGRLLQDEPSSRGAVIDLDPLPAASTAYEDSDAGGIEAVA